MRRASKIFVYGTLKRGFRNHFMMNSPSSVYLGTGRTAAAFPLVTFTDRHVPYLLDVPGVGKQIEGELYLCDERHLQALDDFEGVPAYYRRVSTKIELTEVSDWARMQQILGEEDRKGRTVFADLYTKREFSPQMLTCEFLEAFTLEHNSKYRRKNEYDSYR